MRDRKITVLDEEQRSRRRSPNAPSAFAAKTWPRMRAGAARLNPYLAAIYRRAVATPLPDDFGEVAPLPACAGRPASASTAAVSIPPAGPRGRRRSGAARPLKACGDLELRDMGEYIGRIARNSPRITQRSAK